MIAMMKPALRLSMLLALLATLARPAAAGWIVAWSNVASDARGSEISSEPSTMYIAGGRVRTEQTKMISITDYRNDRLTFLDPVRKLFWNGSVADYVAEMKRTRDEALNERMGPEVGKDPITTDLTKLPRIEIRKDDETTTIAGHETSKYAILAGGQPFQDAWMAADLNVNADLDPKRFIALQLKMSQAMVGRSAANFNALYRDEQYAKLLQNGFALRLKTTHIAGSYERTATSVRSAPVADELFGVPDDYRRVLLKDVFPKEG
jgi:hypothetical protein